MHQMSTSTDAHSVWFLNATVRRATIGPWDNNLTFDWRFPVEMKPLLGHPALLEQPESVRKFIHVHAYHKYLHDVCLTETDVVNRVATDIAYGRSAAMFSPDLAAEAFSILVDEAFHSYSARLFSMHVTRSTGIAPLPMPSRNALVNAYVDVASGQDTDTTAMAQLLCCCLSESTFTKEILAASRLEGYDPAFRSLMEAHLADEGRHYGYFRRILSCYWSELNEERRGQAAEFLPLILATYFDDEDDAAYDMSVLLAVGFAPTTAAAVIDDLMHQKPAIADLPRLRNSLEFLHISGVLSHSLVKERLAEKGFLR